MCQTYRIAICDDLATDRNYLSSLCEIWGSHNSYHIQISEFTSAENFLFHYAEKKDFDILLLDIEMGAMDGVTMARKLRQDNQTVQMVKTRSKLATIAPHLIQMGFLTFFL